MAVPNSESHIATSRALTPVDITFLSFFVSNWVGIILRLRPCCWPLCMQEASNL